VIVKVTSRKLQQEGVVLVDGQKLTVHEDVLKEADILKFLSSQKAASGRQRVVQFVDLFKSTQSLYFVMEHGGHMLFDFVVRVHRYIEGGKLEVAEWRQFVRVLFVQIVEAVRFLHRHGVSHFDISLENLLINDVEVVLDQSGKIKFCADSIDVKLCDFGLAERWSVNPEDEEKSSPFWSSKFCGKSNYKSPECAKGERFRAELNDVWCVGVCLFMMVIGGNLYSAATPEDKSFVQAMEGKLGQLLSSWNRRHYVDDLLLDLLHRIFRVEADRATLDEVAAHRWLRPPAVSSK